jgi:preprotein translocase subunit SecE
MKRLISYIKEASNELIHKVTWPTWKELQGSTILVMVASLIFAMVILGMDSGFKYLMQGIYNILYKI